MKYNVLVGEVMSQNIVTVDMDDPIGKAAEKMRETGARAVLVMGGKNIKGIVTTTDIVYKHVAERKGETAKDIMSSELVKISPNRTIEEAARLMVTKGIEKLPVFDKERLAGMITSVDILRVEPALFEILLERQKAGAMPDKEEDLGFSECENCGNYSDDLEEVQGVYMCSECRE